MEGRRVVVVGVALTAALIAGVSLVLLAQTATPRPGSEVMPRTREGHPDLQGVWQVLNTAAWDIQDHSEERYPGLPARFSVPAGQGVVEGDLIPYQPWAAAQKEQNRQNRLTADPEARCYLPGVPRVTYMPSPFQLFQFRDRVVILYEHLHATREIYTD